MWNPVKLVASNMFLPETEFMEFALKNEDKYRIDVSNPAIPEVGNFWVDALIKDFRAAFPDLCARVRQERIAQFHNKELRLCDFGARG